MKRLYLFLLLTSLSWVACGPNQTDLAATVQAEVNTAVEATIAAIPTATHQPTYTAEPSPTPYPTYTPPNTATPLPTNTPYPTHTPYPTNTPLPTETVTPSPSPTPTAQATTSAVNQSTPTTSGVFTAEAVVNTITLMETMMSILGPSVTQTIGNPIVDWTVDCPTFLATHDRFVATMVVPVVSSDPVVQNAYTNYQTGANIFLNAIAGWVESCRQAIANQEVKSIDSQNWTYIQTQKTQAHNLLEQAKNALSGN